MNNYTVVAWRTGPTDIEVFGPYETENYALGVVRFLEKQGYKSVIRGAVKLTV